MHLPRTNVPQYAGNAVWDGRVLDLPGAVGAMLGDPFQYAVTPELDALRGLFMGLAANERRRRLESRWSMDERYCMWRSSTITQGSFFTGMGGLTPEYVRRHAQWPSIVPAAIRERVEASMASGVAASDGGSARGAVSGWTVHASTNCYDRFGSTRDLEFASVANMEACRARCLRTAECEAVVVGAHRADQCWLRGAVDLSRCRPTPRYVTHVVVRSPWPLSPPSSPGAQQAQLGLEAATCAAVAVMDGLFANRSADDLWKTSLTSGRKAETDPTSLFNALYRRSSEAPTASHPRTGRPAVPREALRLRRPRAACLPRAGTFTERRQEDPHGDVYTTPYQWNAFGFYGGDTTLVFAPAETAGVGSGVDLKWMRSRTCPGPPMVGQSRAEWEEQWCVEPPPTPPSTRRTPAHQHTPQHRRTLSVRSPDGVRTRGAALIAIDCH